MHRTDKYSQHNSFLWPVWLNGWVFVYGLSACGFECRCCHYSSLLSGGMGLIGHHLVFHGCRILQRNLFIFHQKHLCYLKCFQEENGLLWFADCWLKYWTANAILNVFYSLKPRNIGASSLGANIDECNGCTITIQFVLVWTLSYINFLLPYHVEKCCR